MSRQLFEDAKKVLLSEATKLDPVGREDKDIDNDGDSDKTDSYLKKRRGAISNAIAQSKNESVELSEEDAQRLSDILKGVAKETDQIDEVSRETLAAYKDKASDARYRKTLPTAKVDKREAGVSMAMKKLDKKNEEVEQIDEVGDTPAGREALLAVKKRARGEFMKDFPDSNTPRAMKADDLVNRVNDRLSGNRTKRLKGPGNPDNTPYALGGRDRLSARSYSEEVEQVDERVIKGKGYDKPENMRKAPEGNVAMTSLMPGFDERSAKFLARQVKGTMVKGKAQSGPQKEDFDIEDYDLIEKFEVNIPEMPSYQDYVNAALKIAECKAFSELSEEDQEYIMKELEEAVTSNDVSFILEAEAMSDMNDTVQRLRKAGHKVEDMGRDYKGNPFYTYVDKTNNMRRKVTYKGMQKMTQNMGRVQTEKEE
jgi:hypothetical protein